MKHLSRRALIRRGSLALFGTAEVTTRPGSLFAQTAPTADQTAGDPVPPFNRFPRAVHEYYVQGVRAVEQAANERRAALKTKADAEGYITEVREKIRQCFGPFPEKTPLNARVTATREREGYRIENVIFESRPDFPLTANLYLPAGRSQPMPGVIGTCGHSSNGKAAGTYQSFAQGLALKGYVVLIFDPMGQGERLQHVTKGLLARYGIGTHEHHYVGNRMTLLGENLPAWFAWDGIRAVDYLLSRPEVDARHVGVTGNSGGGTQSTWLCGIEPRLTMAAPSCFVTTLRRNIENEQGTDPEQYPWHLLELGLDHSDFIAAMAPKPVILLGQEKDYFDARGFEEAAERMRHLYHLLGAEQNFTSYLGGDYHGYSKANREAMYEWFNQQCGVDSGRKEPELKLEDDTTLQCTASGQVADLEPATVFSFGREKARLLREGRGTPGGAALREAIASALKLPAREGVPDYRILRASSNHPPRQYPTRHFAHYVVETEPGIPVVVTRLSSAPLLSRVPAGPTRALLYVSHRSADAELRDDPWLRELIAAEPKETAVFACDLRGVGESMPALSTPENAAKGGASYFHAGVGLLFGFPMPGQRTFDLLRVFDWLTAHGHREVHLVARGLGAIPGTFAAVLHDSVTRVTLKNALSSYAEVVESEDYQWPLASFVPSVLETFDLPDCYRELESKGLQQIEPFAAVEG